MTTLTDEEIATIRRNFPEDTDSWLRLAEKDPQKRKLLLQDAAGRHRAYFDRLAAEDKSIEIHANIKPAVKHNIFLHDFWINTVIRLLSTIVLLVAVWCLIPAAVVCGRWFAGLPAGQQTIYAARTVAVAAGLWFIFGTIKRLYYAIRQPAAVGAPAGVARQADGNSSSDSGRPADGCKCPEHMRAAHEAGHVVAMAAFGWTIHSVDIIYNPEHEGGGATNGWPSGRDLPQMWQQIVVRMAGVVAEYRMGVCCDGGLTDAGEAAEYAALILAIGKLPPGVDCPLTIDGLLAEGRRLAYNILSNHLNWWFTLTAALEEEKSLGGKRLNELFGWNLVPAEKLNKETATDGPQEGGVS